MKGLLLTPALAFALVGLFFSCSGAETLTYSLDVSFDIPASLVRGVARISLPTAEELKLQRGNLKLVRVRLDGEDVPATGQAEEVRILPPHKGTLEIAYEGVFPEAQGQGEAADVIGAKGVFLTGPWFPKPDRMCLYHVKTVLPAGFEAISEAETMEKVTEGKMTTFSFTFAHPVGGVTLVATDRYKVEKEHFRGIDIFAYFFPEDRDLVPTYLERTKYYLSFYSRLISPFPYKRFSVVENFLPTGYSMPTYTVLGQQVVRLPFIPQTSLGHEILHQWLGNLMYIDYEGGNWAEGLTTFLADHLYEEEKGLGWQYRKDALIDYASYVNDKNEFPMKEFVERIDRASEAIGYGKGVMVFKMLMSLVGKDRFYESVRYLTKEMAFKRTSWADIERAFEKYKQTDLGWFFHQWIDEKGLPAIQVAMATVTPQGSRFKVAFDVVQGKKPFIVDIPAAVYSNGQRTQSLLHLSKEKERFEIMVDGVPERLVLDEDYDVARKLSPDETPPVIARLLGDEECIVVLPPSQTDVYKAIEDSFKGGGERLMRPDQVTNQDIRDHSLVILGAGNPLVGRLYGEVKGEGGFSLVVKRNPWNPMKVAAVFEASSAKEVEEAFPKVSHYGKYSSLSFDRGVNTSKKTEGSARGIERSLLREAAVVEVSSIKGQQDMMDRVADKRVVYVGETHDQFPHHAAELEIIRDLLRRGKKIAIGMEMFERQFQGKVDDYVEGRIDERQFLKGTEYFKRWSFDYNLYRPILLFARSEKIPVLALNQKKEIVDKVFRQGMDSLSEEERKSVPARMDYSDEAYRKRLVEAFEEHESSGTERFDFFYQAQILWDETMAESIARFFESHPHEQAVVLAGSGHLEYGSGIPKRAARRMGGDYAIILNDVDPEPHVADFLLYPAPVPETPSPRLMVLLDQEGAKVVVTGFPEKSVSRSAGMKKGDAILSIGNTRVESVEDLRIDLLGRSQGETVKVRVSRKGIFGSSEKDLEVTLQ